MERTPVPAATCQERVDGIEQHHGGDVGAEHLLEPFEGPAGRAFDVHGRDLALGGPVQVEEQLVDLGEMLDPRRQALSGLVGLLDEIAAEAAGHTDQDELDGELHALVGVGAVRGQEHAGQGHGQRRRSTARPDTTRRPPANPAMMVATPRVMRKGERANPVASTTATPTATSRSSAAVVCHRPCSLADGAQRAPQGVGDEHASGYGGPGPEVLDQPQGERQGQRHPAQGAEDGPELGQVLGRGGPQVPPPEPGSPRQGPRGRYLVGAWFKHPCCPPGSGWRGLSGAASDRQRPLTYRDFHSRS